MVNETIVKFIRQYSSQGYGLTEIRDYLLKYGFPLTQIDEAVDYFQQHPSANTGALAQSSHIGSHEQQSFMQSKQPTPQLVNYIQQQIAKGHTPDVIRNYLLQYGYDAGQVEQAIQAASSPNSHIKHTIAIHPKTLLGIFLILIAVAGIVFGAMSLFGNSSDFPELLDYSLQIDEGVIAPGEKLNFINKIANLGEKRRYDIFIEYKIINKDTLEELTSWSKTFAIDVIVDKLDSVLIPPGTAPGKYILYGEVYYGDLKNKASNTFKVLSTETEESCFDNLQNQDESGVDCGGSCFPCETCDDGLQNQNEEDVDCGGVCGDCETCFDGIINQDEEDVDCGGICSIPCEGSGTTEDNTNATDIENKNNEDTNDNSGGTTNSVETILLAKETATDNVDLALEICEKLTEQNLKDGCIREIAQVSKQSELCEKIVNANKKDPCYMHFVTNYEDYDLCDSIINDAYKDSCLNLKKISTLQSTYGEGNNGTTDNGIKTDPIVEPSPNPEPTPNIPDEPDEPEPNNDLPPEPTPEPIGQEIIFTNIQTIKIDYKTYKVKWTTNVPEKSVLKFGTHPEALINIAYDEAEVSNHQITLNDLNVNTKYYFMIINQNSEGEYFTSDVESFETKA
ncbi:hypothetical protein HN695_00230 [Candidatus Woesearchaeota archaeon]|jgi:hypothetical protein|nr:hypothetical protein [Candidatus Woesearchaeota archaeon]MBT5272553.1 hypothetical protein [Candidatus Woesearchaeota archaeon]MBT6041298.1 hypothetical protein [Candidatus Woesearchaeota archaeon]MBT6337105.1 hypothetical protein [Candidatus Woesearchaeota archaeon]MBT7926740.1 hypothetical protein [Candidatus Woesearchaeota archaeon]